MHGNAFLKSTMGKGIALEMMESCRSCGSRGGSLARLSGSAQRTTQRVQTPQSDHAGRSSIGVSSCTVNTSCGSLSCVCGLHNVGQVVLLMWLISTVYLGFDSRSMTFSSKRTNKQTAFFF